MTRESDKERMAGEGDEGSIGYRGDRRWDGGIVGERFSHIVRAQ